MDFTGRATSTTASSWAWVPGPAGAMATAGADIASPMMAAETIAAAAEPLRIAATMPVAAAEQPYAAPAYRALRRQYPMQAEQQGQQQVMPRFNIAAAVVVKFGVVAAAAAKPGAAVVAVVVTPVAVVVVMQAAAAASNL